MTHMLFDTDYNEVETYITSHYPIEYETCEDHAFHNGDGGRWICVREEDGRLVRI